MTTRKTLSLLATAAAVVAVPATAQTIIAPTSAVINLGGPGDGNIADTYNQAGLSTGYTAGVTNFDTYLAGNPTHTLAFSGNEWFSNAGTNAATVTYDFGSIRGIDRLALWNEESSGIGLLNLLTSTNGTTFTALGTFTPPNNPIGSNYPASVFSFAATSARYVRFQMTGCPQVEANAYTACAIGEVAFRSAVVGGAVPEPATWAMMIGGFGLVGASMRRRSTKVAFAA